MTAWEDLESEVVLLLASPVTRVGMGTGSVVIDGVVVASSASASCLSWLRVPL